MTDKSDAIKNYLHSRLARARFWSKAHPIKVVISVSASKRDRLDNLVYKLSFSEGDLVGVDIPYNDALVLMINICNFDVKRILIDPGSSLEVMCLNLYEKLKTFIPAKNVRAIDAPIYIFSGEPIWTICIVEVLVRVGEMVVNI